jgi:hypothetical protein
LTQIKGGGLDLVQLPAVERNWLFVLSIVATLVLSVGGVSILLFAM